MTLLRAGDDLVVRAFGAADRPEVRAAVVYFNLVYYASIQLGQRLGVRRIWFGPSALEAKRGRGLTLVPLIGAVGPGGDPLRSLLTRDRRPPARDAESMAWRLSAAGAYLAGCAVSALGTGDGLPGQRHLPAPRARPAARFVGLSIVASALAAIGSAPVAGHVKARLGGRTVVVFALGRPRPRAPSR